jgi:hypothetical protein
VTVGKACAVEVLKCVEDRSEYFASLFFSEWTVGENLSEVFLSVLHEHEDQIHVRKPAATAR